MKSNPSDQPTQERAAKNGTTPFRTKHEDPVQDWIQQSAHWNPRPSLNSLRWRHRAIRASG